MQTVSSLTHSFRKRAPNSKDGTASISTEVVSNVGSRTPESSVAFTATSAAISSNNGLLADTTKVKDGRPRGGRGDKEPLPEADKPYNEDVHPKETAWLWEINPPLWLLIGGPFVVVAIVSFCCCYCSYLWRKQEPKEQDSAGFTGRE